MNAAFLVVEPRGFEPLTSAVQKPTRCYGFWRNQKNRDELGSARNGVGGSDLLFRLQRPCPTLRWRLTLPLHAYPQDVGYQGFIAEWFYGN